MTSQKVKACVFSLATALVLGFSGCGGGSSDPDGGSGASSIALDGKAVDGYLAYATVCLDLSDDGYCQADTEPFSITDATGSFNLNITPTQQQDPRYANAKLLVYGGQDIDTKKDFFGKLKAPLEAGATRGSINVTPLTTMVAEMVDANLSVSEAKQKVAQVLNITPEDLDKDPVAEADQKPELIKAALKVQKTIEVLAKAVDGNATKDTVADMYKNIATALAVSTDANVSFENTIRDVADEHDDIDTDDLNGALAVAETIDDLNVSSTATVSTIVESVKREIVDNVVDGNESVDDLNITDIVEASPAELYAKGLLEFLGYTAEEIDSLKTDVANALSSIIESDAPTPQAEIAALRGYTSADLSGVATKYEEKIEELDDQAKVATSNIPFPNELYFVDEKEDGNLTIGKLVFSNGHVIESAEALTSTGDWVPYEDEHKNYALVNGTWIDENGEAYTLYKDNTILKLASGMSVKVVEEVDLANPPAKYASIIQQMASEYGLESNVSFSEGAKGYIVAMNGTFYSLYEPERDWSNASSVTYYSTLEDFVNSRIGSNGNWFEGYYNGGYAFGQTVTSISNNDTGTIVHVHRENNGTIVVDNNNAGIWKAVELAGETAILVDIPADEDGWKNLFTLFDDGNGKVVWRGDYRVASDKFQIDEEVVFNAQAITDIKNAVAQQLENNDASSENNSSAGTSAFSENVTGSFVDDLASPQTGTFYHVYPDEDNGTQFWTLEQLDVTDSNVTWSELNTTDPYKSLESGTDSIVGVSGNVVTLQSSEDDNRTFNVTFDKKYDNGILVHIQEAGETEDDFLFFNRANAENFYNNLQ